MERRSSIEEEYQKIDEFFSLLQKPANLETVRHEVDQFCQRQRDKRIVLITSGGTTIPLEYNTVRFLDNFSAGTRGSASAEHFLESGYAVIFLYRAKSLEPFLRHFNMSDIFNSFSVKNQQSIEVSPEMTSKLIATLNRRQQTKDNLLLVTFTTLAEYLYNLKEIALLLQPLGANAMLYLAAAVSDFYIPPAKMSQHKIQSSDGPLRVHFELVPKVLRPLVRFWVPHAFVISFKLETQESILLVKARQALNKYGHKLVIANELNTRKNKVTLVSEEEFEEITVKNEDDIEIESLIVENVIKRHEAFRNANQMSLFN